MAIGEVLHSIFPMLYTKQKGGQNSELFNI